jgi:hypothetical protein
MKSACTATAIGTTIRPGNGGKTDHALRLKPDHLKGSGHRDELLNGEIFYSLAEAKIIIEAWRRYYNTERPHSSLGYKPPAPETIVWPAPPRRSAPPSAQAMAGKPIMH